MANNFTADANCKALWSLESGALTVDSKDSVTLTNSGVTANTSTFREKLASGGFVAASTQYMYLANASLPAGFPLRSDDTNKKISVAGWVYMNSLPSGANTIYAVYDSGGDERSFVLQIRNISGNARVTMVLGFNAGISTELISHASNLSLSTWYHITATYDNADKSCGIYVRDINGVVVENDYTTPPATLDVNKLYVGTGALTVGCFYVSGAPLVDYIMNGLVDELAVFSDILSSAEATRISKGIYGEYAGFCSPVYDADMDSMRGVL